MEVTHHTSEEHEALVSLVHKALHDEDESPPRKGPWMPHSSIAYDNPGPAPISPEYLLSLIERFPTLRNERKVKAIGLWKTAGTMDCWKLVDRIMFDEEDVAGNAFVGDSKMEVASSIAGSSDAASIENEGRDEDLSVFL